MKTLLIKDKHRRYLFNKLELEYNYLNFLKRFLKNYNLNDISINLKKKKYNNIGRMRIRINSRCILTNRGKAIFRKFHISRIQLRLFALKGALSGIKKSSW